MKIALVLLLVISSTRLNFACEDYFFNPLNPQTSFFSKQRQINFWSERFSPQTFLRQNPDVHYNKMIEEARLLEGRSDVFDQNINRFINHLFHHEKITASEYNQLRGLFQQTPQRIQAVQEIINLPSMNHLRNHGPFRQGINSELAKTISESKLLDSQLTLLKTKLQSLDVSSDSGERLIEFIQYMNTLSRAKLPRALDAISQLYNPQRRANIIQNTILRRFYRLEEKIDSMQERVVKKLSRHYKNENNGTLSEILQRRISNEASAKANHYRSTLYNCSNRDYISPNGVNNSKRFVSFMTGSSIVNTGLGYTSEHWSEDKTTHWWKGLAFEVVLETFLVWYNSKISTNHDLSFVSRSLKSYSTSAGIDLFDSFAYQVLIGNDNVNAEDAPKAAQIRELIQNFENENADQIMSARLRESFGNDSNTNGRLNNQDLENPGYADFIFQYLSEQTSYDVEQGWENLNSSIGYKRFMFNRKWELGYVPINLYMNQFIYHTLCMSDVNLPKAYLVAGLVIFSFDYISSRIYYAWRNESIDI